MQQMPYTTLSLCRQEQEEGNTGFICLFVGCLFVLPCTTSIKNDLTHKNSKQTMMKSIIVSLTISLAGLHTDAPSFTHYPYSDATTTSPTLILMLPQPVLPLF